MSPGERLLGLDLANGGHLTHGMKLNFSGEVYESGCYGVDSVTGLIDMEAVRAKAIQFRPKVLIAGWSAYPRIVDFAAFRDIADEVGAHLWVDWRTSPAWSPPDCTPTRCRTPTWCRPPCTRRWVAHVPD